MGNPGPEYYAALQRISRQLEQYREPTPMGLSPDDFDRWVEDGLQVAQNYLEASDRYRYGA